MVSPQITDDQRIDFQMQNVYSRQRIMPNMNIKTEPQNNQNDSNKNFMKIPEFLERYINQVMKVEFLTGNYIVEKIGRLIAAGENYIVLHLLEQRVIVVCESSSIKYITILLDDNILSEFEVYS